MTGQFPPESRYPDQVANLLEIYKSVLPGSPEAWYVSSPLTTGRRLKEAHALQMLTTPEEIARVLDEKVIAPNRAAAREYVDHLREHTARYVIDPTAVGELRGWSQADYHFLWGRVIELFVSCVVFRDGWELSNGCSYEFLIAARNRLRILDEGLNPLSEDDGMDLLAKALSADRSSGDSKFRWKVLQALKRNDQ